MESEGLESEEELPVQSVPRLETRVEIGRIDHEIGLCSELAEVFWLERVWSMQTNCYRTLTNYYCYAEGLLKDKQILYALRVITYKLDWQRQQRQNVVKPGPQQM